ncbi:MAG TPA: DNA-processing protein DprA [Solirubrobacteraceae bacterium]|nr:DNA-processing protein DprA [Solirubrobacteraceae bacterium]
MTFGGAACDACLRRAWLLGRLSGHIEIARRAHAVLPELLALPSSRLLAAVGGTYREEIEAQLARVDIEEQRRKAITAGLAVTCRHDEAYPPQLRDAGDAPAALYVAGRLEALPQIADPDQRTIAIVGARRASREGLEVARALGRDLALAGVPVISGMALGVDAAAQRGALDGGGLSVAVLGGGADVAYPPSKARLHDALLERGLVVSELPPGTSPRRWTFPARNRVIAALADLTVVVEAAERSGSLITADLALRLGRDVAAVPGSVVSPQTAGSNALLRDGATLVRGVDDVLDALYGAGAAPSVPRGAGETLEPQLVEMLDVIRSGHTTIEALATATGDDVSTVLIGLTELELRGLVQREPGGRYAVRL